MSATGESENTISGTFEREETNDLSLSDSDSWTVLDSSHLQEEGDLSDAESVEVLATEELPCREVDLAHHADEDDTCIKNDAVSSDLFHKPGETVNEADVVSERSSVVSNLETAIPTTGEEQPKEEINKKWLREALVGVALELSIFSLLLDLIFLGLLGLSMAGIDHEIFPLSLRSTKNQQQFEVDPLSLQLSHVLANWKKSPLEDHSIDRHVLKTLLLYYSESSELSANIHFLTEKVQKNNEMIKHLRKISAKYDYINAKKIVSGHLAHSIACILGKHDHDNSLPADFAMTADISDEAKDFAPEPGFWLNDWRLPRYFKANDTYYHIETKPLQSPMRSLFLHLGSAQWNQYFWELYQKNENSKNLEGFGASGNVIDVDLEETERSPLEMNAAGDFSSNESASGRILNVPDPIEGKVPALNSLFVERSYQKEVGDLPFDQNKENFKLSLEKCQLKDCGGLEDELKLVHQSQEKEKNIRKPVIFDEGCEILKKKKSKPRVGKQKHKSDKFETDSSKNKKRENRSRPKRAGSGFEGQKMKSKLKDGKKKQTGEIEGETSFHKSSFQFDEKISDWNTRMAEGREKLRAQGQRVDDKMWLFERARARRESREESYSQ